CRRYLVADPMPRSDLIAPAKPQADAIVERSQLPEIEPADHPWGPLLAGRNPTVETLAQFTPRDCYYLRVNDALKFDAFMPSIVEWVTSVAGWIDGNGRDFRLLERYQRQLLFPRDAAGRPRMPSFVHEFAVVGSDPHFRTGTDVTIIFRMTNGPLFRDEIDAA